MGVASRMSGLDGGSYAVQQASSCGLRECLFDAIVLEGGDSANVVSIKYRVTNTARAWPLRVECGLRSKLEATACIAACFG